jgi:hypothetical protein
LPFSFVSSAIQASSLQYLIELTLVNMQKNLSRSTMVHEKEAQGVINIPDLMNVQPYS